jgi:hypothetical protein
MANVGGCTGNGNSIDGITGAGCVRSDRYKYR